MLSSFETLESRTLMSVSAAEKANIQQLVTDLKAIHAKSDVTTAQWQTLQSDFKSIAAVANRPSAASTTKLRTDARRVFGDKVVTSAEKTLLASDVKAVLVSANVPADLAQKTATDLKAIVTASHVTKADVKTIFNDITAIYSGL